METVKLNGTSVIRVKQPTTSTNACKGCFFYRNPNYTCTEYIDSYVLPTCFENKQAYIYVKIHEN